MIDDNKKPPTPAERIAAAQQRRDAIREEHAHAYAEQQATDLEVVAALEDEHGFERVLRIDVGGWKAGEGAATLVVVRIPKSSESVFKRYEQTVSKAKTGTTAGLDAAHMLAEACLLYPSKKNQKDLYDATMELASGIRSNMAFQIAKVVQGNAEEEKKD